jgi:hypothetical protein
MAMVEEATMVAAEDADDGWVGRWLCSVFFLVRLFFSLSPPPPLKAKAMGQSLAARHIPGASSLLLSSMRCRQLQRHHRYRCCHHCRFHCRCCFRQHHCCRCCCFFRCPFWLIVVFTAFAIAVTAAIAVVIAAIAVAIAANAAFAVAKAHPGRVFLIAVIVAPSSASALPLISLL